MKKLTEETLNHYAVIFLAVVATASTLYLGLVKYYPNSVGIGLTLASFFSIALIGISFTMRNEDSRLSSKITKATVLAIVGTLVPYIIIIFALEGDVFAEVTRILLTLFPIAQILISLAVVILFKDFKKKKNHGLNKNKSIPLPGNRGGFSSEHVLNQNKIIPLN